MLRIGNPKFQLPNPKQIQNSKFKIQNKMFWSFESCSLIIVCPPAGGLVLDNWCFRCEATVMGTEGIEPSTSILSEWRSTAELCAPIQNF